MEEKRLPNKEILIILLIFIMTFSTISFCNINDNDKDTNFKKVFLDKQTLEFKLLSSNLNFDISFLKLLLNNEQNKNIFYSPFGLQILLSLLLNGTRGESFDDIRSLLNYKDFDINSINKYYQNFLQKIVDDKQGELNIANSIWINKANELYKKAAIKNLPIVSSNFIDICKDYYFSQIFEKDLMKDSEFKILDNWILKATKNKIKNIIKKSDINSDLTLLLINAIYFKNEWQIPFDKKNTKTEEFTKMDGSKKSVEFMNFDSAKSLYYFEDEKLQIVRLPYKGYTKSLIIVLPKNINETMEIFNSFNSKNFIELIDSMKLNKGYVKFPKIKCENEYDFTKLLKNIGITSIFNASKDFHTIFNSDLADLQYFLFGIGKIWQKTYLEIDEKGTTAAAATGVSIFKSATAIQQKFFYFNADHPFIYFLFDDLSGNIIFSRILGF